MRSSALLWGLCLGCAAALAAAVGCKTSTAAGGAGSADGGMMMTSDGGAMGAMGGMADAGSSMAREMGQGAGTAAGTVASGVRSAGEAMADAGGQAATTAADAARQAAAGAKEGAAAAMDAGTTMGGADAATAAPAGPTDPQIAAIAVAANDVDIAAAKMAKKQTKNAKVRQFANLMIKDHTSVNKQAGALVKKLGVTPEENDTSRSLRKGGDDNMASLKSLKGKDFDKAYAQHEVDYHQQVLDAINNVLIPNAKNEELKTLLQKVGPVVQEHLDHAKQLVEDLSK